MVRESSGDSIKRDGATDVAGGGGETLDGRDEAGWEGRGAEGLFRRSVRRRDNWMPTCVGRRIGHSADVRMLEYVGL